jgi:outer membrane receptor protein involved in Fe transport
MVKLNAHAGIKRREQRVRLNVLLAGASLAGLVPAAAQAQTPAPTAASPAAAAASQAAPASATALDTVIVTARKRSESVAKVPTSITVFNSAALQTYNITSFNDYASKTPSLSFSYGGGPTGISEARSVAIRGITGQNLTGTAGATGFYIDDTPVPSSVDPRVLDIDDIEVLKGPQGTLYGESSLAGNVRLITKKPNLNTDSLTVTGDVGATSHGGSPDGGVGLVGNKVLVPDELAVRTVLFYDHEAGYLTRTYPTDPNSPGVTDPSIAVPRTAVGDQGAITSYGGSISALWKMTDNFEARFRVMAQDQTDNGFPATFAPLPSFTPDYTLDRAFNVQPRASDFWALPSVDLQYFGDGWTVTSSVSYFHRDSQDVEDSTYGTQQVLASYYGVNIQSGPNKLPPQPFLWVGNHDQNQYTTETRLSFEPIDNLSGTVGVFYSNAHVRFSIPNTYAQGLVAATQSNAVVGPWPNDLIWNQQEPETEQDVSLFGEFYYKFLDKFSLTLGGRQYWLNQTADYTANGFMNFGVTPSNPQQNSESGFDPKVSLAYQATDAAMVYASASKGFRAGGAQPLVTFCESPDLNANDITHVKSDTLWTYEGGTKLQLSNPGLLISAAGYHIDWQNPQLQVSLPCGAYLSINAQAATINGGEIELTGHVTDDLQVRAGLGYESTDITEPGPTLTGLGVTPGTRIFGTPAWTATAAAAYSRQLTDRLEGFASADYSYTGNSVQLLNGGVGEQYTRPAYSLVNARFGVRWNGSEISLNMHNLTNTKANLGDIGYVGYAQFNSAGQIIPQVATLQPLTITLQYKWVF